MPVSEAEDNKSDQIRIGDVRWVNKMFNEQKTGEDIEDEHTEDEDDESTSDDDGEAGDSISDAAEINEEDSDSENNDEGVSHGC